MTGYGLHWIHTTTGQVGPPITVHNASWSIELNKTEEISPHRRQETPQHHQPHMVGTPLRRSPPHLHRSRRDSAPHHRRPNHRLGQRNNNQPRNQSRRPPCDF